MRKTRLVEYQWDETAQDETVTGFPDEQGEMATLTYEDGRVVRRHQPIKVAANLRDSYFSNLLIWIDTEYAR